MKICPFCAEEIQDAAIVCKHCGHDLPRADVRNIEPTEPPPTLPPPPPFERYKYSGVVKVLGIIAVVLVILGALFSVFPIFPEPPKPDESEALLHVRGARGVLGFSFTNYESVPLADCNLVALDGDAEWGAMLDGKTIRPSETLRVFWAKFTDHDQPLPAHIGMSVKNFRLRCVAGNDWKRANMWF